MIVPININSGRLTLLLAIATLFNTGCRGIGCQRPYGDKNTIYVAPEGTPRELCKTIMPDYRIEPPDMLVIDAISAAPRPDYRLRVGDVVNIECTEAFPDSPIAGEYEVLIGGVVDLKSPYGTVQIAGLTIEEAGQAVKLKLADHLKEPGVTMSILAANAIQQIKGEHLVKSDGTVRLGGYGSTIVAGLTLDEAEIAIEAHLSRFLDRPDVAVDIFAFNSKSYYIIMQGGGFGDQFLKVPHRGGETVLDALTELGGLTEVSSKRIWIARPGPNWQSGDQVLPVDYDAIARFGATETNYQLLPGDRLYIEEDAWVAWDTNMGKVLAPFERIMGFSLLGASTVSRFSGKVLSGGGQGQFGGGGVF